MKEIQEAVIHKTDLDFVRYCRDCYGVNRGVYNTIDQWFYTNNVQNVIDRRKYVLCFFIFVYGDNKGSGKFGKEGLVSKLHQFWNGL